MNWLKTTPRFTGASLFGGTSYEVHNAGVGRN